MSKDLDTIIETLNKKFGENTIGRLGSMPSIETERISSGSPYLNFCMGGGWPLGRTVELYGIFSCIDKDTFIPYFIIDKNGKLQNSKGGTIEHLYERFNKIERKGKGYYQRRQTIKSSFLVSSVNEKGFVFKNPIINVIDAGKKQCFELKTESGKSIISTKEHKFLTIGNTYKQLKDLKIADIVFVNNSNRPLKKYKQTRYNEICVKYHPVWRIKNVDKYIYHRGRYSHLVYEAYLNNISVFIYRNILNTKSKKIINKMRFIKKEYIIHHKDGNPKNDNLKNLKLIKESEHNRYHANRNHKNGIFGIKINKEKIISIKNIGLRNTYDISCLSPYNNYIANKIVVHNSGKSLIALRTVAEFQKLGKNVVYLDSENAFSPEFAKHIGIDVKKLIISQISAGEEVFDIIDKLLDTEVSLIVVDSVASLLPNYEAENEMQKQTIGLHARLMSKGLRKITAKAAKNKTLIIFINQIREKPTMYGCVHGETLVNFTDGRSFPIKKVVENKIEGYVWTFNEILKKYESSKIINWHFNGRVKNRNDYIHIQTTSIDGKGRFGITVTPDHKVLTSTGWKKAKKIVLNDKLLSKYNQIINGSLADFMWGTFVGDSHLRIGTRNTASYQIRNTENIKYQQWKLSKIARFFDMNRNGDSYESNYLYEFSIIKNKLKNKLPSVMLEKYYSPMSMALWYMDDGCLDTNNYHKRSIISAKRIKNNQNEKDKIEKILKRKGLNVSVSKQGNIYFDTKSTNKLHYMIRKYIPTCMQYKLTKNHQNKYIDFDLSNKPEIKQSFVDVILVRKASNRQMRIKGKYDISIENNHNYMVGGYKNGVIIHNSPNLTTGGRALGFYASLRVEVSRGELIEENKKVIGQQVKFKVTKSKVSPPFRDGYFLFYHPDLDIKTPQVVFDDADELVSMLLIQNKITRRGAYYDVVGKTFQGREELEKEIRDNPDFQKQLNELWKEKK